MRRFRHVDLLVVGDDLVERLRGFGRRGGQRVHDVHREVAIDRIYSFDDIAEAHRYVDIGRKHGNVVVRIAVS